MIYRKDDKILVSGGKLCKSCCMIVSECAECTDYQPAKLILKPSSFIDLDCCDVPGYSDCSASGLAAYLNGNEFDVPHSTGCVYTKALTGDFGTYTLYSSTDGSCDPWYYSATIERLWFTLTLTATGIHIRLEFAVEFGGPTHHEFFIGNILYTGDDECGDTENSASNTPGCYDPITSGGRPVGESGIINVGL